MLHRFHNLSFLVAKNWNIVILSLFCVFISLAQPPTLSTICSVTRITQTAYFLFDVLSLALSLALKTDVHTSEGES